MQEKEQQFRHDGFVNVAAHIASTEAEGPGKRYALWVQGCPMRCSGCCNPHMLEYKEVDLQTPETLVQNILQTEGIEGITLIGGEPFTQAVALTEVAKHVRSAGLSVMAFTGFTLEYIRKQKRQDWEGLLQHIDLLVDGPYIPTQHVTNRRWIGSSNQKIHYLTKRYEHLQEKGWDRGKNTIEIRMKGDQISINGFPHQKVTDVLELLASRSIKKDQPKTGGS